MRKINREISSIASSIAFVCVFVFLISACKNKESNSTAVSTQQNVAISVENSTPVTQVFACKVLTAEDLVSVYPDSKFKVQVDRNDPPNIYEALSACKYEEEGKELAEKYFVDLEIRAMPSAADAKRFLSGKKEMDYDKKGKSVAGYGDDAYYSNLSMVSGGPRFEFVKENVYYKINIQTIKLNAAGGLEAQSYAIAKKVLD